MPSFSESKYVPQGSPCPPGASSYKTNGLAFSRSHEPQVCMGREPPSSHSAFPTPCGPPETTGLLYSPPDLPLSWAFHINGILRYVTNFFH